MNPPAVVIKIEFERLEPLVAADYISEEDQARMMDWLRQRPDLADLISHALDLEQERAA
jgi:hypothetical protein